MVTHPVHTPQVNGVTGAAMEQETYRWFVANDIGTGPRPNHIAPRQQPLTPLDQRSTALPTLDRHEWRG